MTFGPEEPGGSPSMRRGAPREVDPHNRCAIALIVAAVIYGGNTWDLLRRARVGRLAWTDPDVLVVTATQATGRTLPAVGGVQGVPFDEQP
jgi:hypothetical protein